MWWLISLGPDRARGWGFDTCQRAEETLPLEVPGDRADWGLAAEKRVLRERNMLEQLPFLITVPRFRPQSAHLWDPSVKCVHWECLMYWCVRKNSEKRKHSPPASHVVLLGICNQACGSVRVRVCLWFMSFMVKYCVCTRMCSCTCAYSGEGGPKRMNTIFHYNTKALPEHS